MAPGRIAEPRMNINNSHAPAIGECTEDTLQLQAIWPVRPATSYRGEQGFAVYAWSAHSKRLQPAGTWHATELAAMKERSEILELLDMECAA
jgi:hypothetical protein